ncbi:MAG: 3-methyl-2-oxobutanoate hydroxymethyltransferase [Burkholderiales bacterium]
MHVHLSQLHKMARQGEKIAALTCYDASFAALLEEAGVDILLVGDSLGMVLQGEANTLGVTLEQMQYHTRCVARTSGRAYIIADMPLGSYQERPAQAMRNAARLLAAGAHMVKLEGGQVMAATVSYLVKRGVPVCGHIGLTPQSIHQLGGYRVQGRTEPQAAQLLEDAVELEQAGAGLLVLEAIPVQLATRITQQVTIPTIGIGAGPNCSGQVLVLYDVLGIYAGKRPRFAKDFMRGAGSVQAAIKTYVTAVKNSRFPGAEHCF